MNITLPVPPSANRYWRVFNGRAVMSSQARDYKSLVEGLCWPEGAPNRDRARELIMELSGLLMRITK